MAPNRWWTNWNLNYVDSDYGTLTGGFSVQEAAYNTLQKWMPAYVAEVNRQIGDSVLKVPRPSHYRPEMRNSPTANEAQILVVVPGLASEPERTSSGWIATWRMETSVCYFGGSDWQSTQATTQAYGACIRGALCQHPSLEGFAETTRWVGEEYLENDSTATRVIGLQIVHFEVTVDSAMATWGGPPDPIAAPTGVSSLPSILPTPLQPDVASSHVSVTNEEV